MGGWEYCMPSLSIIAHTPKVEKGEQDAADRMAFRYGQVFLAQRIHVCGLRCFLTSACSFAADL